MGCDLCCLTLFFALKRFFVIDDNNMFKHIRNQAVISELEDEIATMKRDSAEIVKRQNRLDYRGDVDAIEELAREKYDMHKDNEDVFVIE